MTNTETIQKLHKIRDYAVRTGNHELAARTLRLLEKNSGETWTQHYGRRWAERPRTPGTI